MVVRWSGGILTSELLVLGDADADARWIGLRRHQAILALSGIGLVADWLVRPNGSFAEVAFGVVLVAVTAPLGQGHTVAEHAATCARYARRSRWSTVTMADDARGCVVEARGHATFAAYQLEHRGRLDLSGRDGVIASSLAALVDGIGVAGRSRHVSVHVQSRGAGGSTVLALPVEVPAPEGWRETATSAHDIAGIDLVGSTVLLERRRYLRTAQGLVTTIRIRDFSATPKGRALLEGLHLTRGDLTLAVHVDVVAGARATRVVERAVHRSRTDGAASLAAGFRRTARVQGHAERTAQRETLVASGRALVRLAVFVTVRSRTYDELRVRVSEVISAAHASGLRCDPGPGRQVEWYCFQLPGGPGW